MTLTARTKNMGDSKVLLNMTVQKKTDYGVKTTAFSIPEVK